MTSTVYLLGGAFSGLNNYMPAMLQGKITGGQNQIQVPYNNVGLFRNTVQQGATMLNAYLNSGTGTMVVFGHSLGAVVSCYWLANYAADSGIDPADLSFVFIGNSVHPYGGALGPESGSEWENWFGADVAAPTDTPYTVTDIIRQYDGWADWPTGSFNIDAELNALAGQNSIHPNYQNVNPDPAAPGNVSYTPEVGGSPGNITYIWSQTTPVPILGTTWGIEFIEELDQDIRPTIESAYDRPVSIPAPGTVQGGVAVEIAPSLWADAVLIKQVSVATQVAPSVSVTALLSGAPGVTVVVTPNVSASAVVTRQASVGVDVTPDIAVSSVVIKEAGVAVDVTPEVSAAGKTVFPASSAVTVTPSIAVAASVSVPGPVFDTVGAGGINEGSTSATWSHTAAAGADIFAFCETPTASTSYNPSGVTYNGTAMTLYGSNYANTDGGLQLWHLAAAGTGGSASLVATWANAFSGVCNSISFTQVTSVSSAADVEGTSGTPTQSVTLTGKTILQSFGFSSTGGTTPIVSGGTARYNGTDSAGTSGLTINTATATTAFTASAADPYNGIAVQLS